MTTEFEGDEVSGLSAYLPAARLEAPEAYQRGTVLTLQVEVRVRSVRLEEDRKGDLTRIHMLALETVSIVGSETPAERRAAAEAAHQAIVDAAKQELSEAEARDEKFRNAGKDYPAFEGRGTTYDDGSFDEPIPYVLTDATAHEGSALSA